MQNSKKNLIILCGVVIVIVIGLAIFGYIQYETLTFIKRI